MTKTDEEFLEWLHKLWLKSWYDECMKDAPLTIMMKERKKQKKRLTKLKKPKKRPRKLKRKQKKKKE